MGDIEYNSSNLLYQFDTETTEDIMRLLSQQLKTRRLERGLSREALSLMSGVPVSTITKFEQQATLSLRQYVAICQALGYKEPVKQLMAQPIYHTMEELETIRNNQDRKHGRNTFRK